MQNKYFKKSLAVGIFLLFIGVIFATGITNKLDSYKNISGDNITNDITKNSSTVLLDENFSGTFPPDGWETGFFGQNNSTCCDSEPPCARGKYSGGYYDNFMKSKAIDASNYEKCIIKFYFGAQGYFPSYFNVYLKYRRNETSSWIDITPWTNPMMDDVCEYYETEITYNPEGCGEALQIKWEYLGYYYYYLDFLCIDDVKIFGNNPPYEPSDPYPIGGDFSICPPNLSWAGGDPDGDNVTYDVYFGEECPPPLIATNITNTWYQLSNLLDFQTNYCWTIVAKDEYGLNTSGPIWTFTTEENYPPYPPSIPNPIHNAENIPINTTICWQGGDPNECDIVTYDVYFGTTLPPTMMSSNQTETYYDPPGNLTLFKVYYWKVAAWDRGGLCTQGPVWTFTTGGPPYLNPPIIDGPTHGKVGLEYTYTFNSTDNIENLFEYQVDWGDNSPIEIVYPTWPNPEKPGPGIANHSWEKNGTYVIMARIHDIFDCYSNWSTFTVKMPKEKAVSNILLLKLLEKYPILNRLFQWFVIK